MEDNPMVPGGEFAGRYAIERELGRGGAATVYLALDSRQERQVALKVLHRELAQAIGAQRFLREIKHSSSLHHPHLLAIHESGESDGFLYYVMPYMSDGSLRARIAKEKQLSIDESLRITRQVGEALAYAHSRGIVHRDIKPDNVLFSADHACLADFGIARALDAAAPDTLTSTGLVVGTPAYMSPEQASGERQVDARSDQYSLACILYEMITGLPPFIGATTQSVISQRFTQPPPSMQAHRPSAPDHVERAVKRALSVAPADRFPSVKGFIAALHDPAVVAEPVSAHSIRRRWFAVGAAAALVTLAVMAAGPGSEWVRGTWGTQLDSARFVVVPFSGNAGVPVDVTTSFQARLARWNGISVVDEGTVRKALAQRDDGRVTLDDAFGIARSLGAGRLLWASIAHPSQGVQINAGLYDVHTRSVIRDTVYTGTGARLSDSTLQRLANALLAVPSLPPEFDDGQGGTSSYEAWQAYGRGLIALDGGAFKTAQRELSAATRADPRFAAANLWLAHVSSIISPKSQHEWAPIVARATASRAQLGSRDAMRAEGLLAFGRGDYERACAISRTLTQGDSLDAQAWFFLGECLLADPQLMRDGRSPSGWRFRSGWHSAGRALLRAVEIEPRLHSPEMFSRLRRVFPTSFNQLRTGVYADDDSVFMYAYPTASQDTVNFIPYSADATAHGRAKGDPASHARVLDRNKETLLRSARTWVSVAPQSADALEALAGVLESRGQLVGQDPNSSALASLRRARSLADGGKALTLGVMEVRLLLKAEQFEGARALADSALRTVAGSETAPEIQGVLSAFTGKPAGMVSGIRVQHLDDLRSLEAPVLNAGAEFLAYSAVGACAGRLEDLERRLDRLLLSYVAPAKMSAIRRRLTDDALSLSAPCSAGASALRLESPSNPLLRMQQEYARGSAASVRAGFDSLARMRRGSRASDLSPSHLIREAWLRAAIGDTAGAVRQLDLVLEALPSVPAVMLENTIQAASLVRAMALRAELGAARGERDVTRRWARAVVTLWSGGDPVLRPTVQKMRKLAE